MPTAYHGKDTQVYVNGVDLTGYSNAAGPAFTKDAADASVFGSQSKKYISGQRDASYQVSGLFDGTTGAVDEVMDGFLGTTAALIFSHMPLGDTTGLLAYGLVDSKPTGYTATSPVGGIVSFEMSVQGSDGASRYIIGKSAGTANEGSVAGTTGVGPAYNHGTSGPAGTHRAFLQVTALTTGLTSLTATIQSSTDAVFTTPTTHATFAAASAVSAQQISFSTSMYQYQRVSWTAVGASTAENVNFHAGIARP